MSTKKFYFNRFRIMTEKLFKKSIFSKDKIYKTKKTKKKNIHKKIHIKNYTRTYKRKNKQTQYKQNIQK